MSTTEKRGLWSGLNVLTKIAVFLGAAAFLATWVPPFILPPSHDFKSKPDEAANAIVKELQILIFASTFGAFVIFVPLELEALHKLGEREARDEEDDELRKSINNQLREIRAELPRWHVCEAMNKTFDEAEALKARHAHFSKIVDAFVKHNLGGLRSILAADQDYRFELNGHTHDGGQEIWKAFIDSANHSFFGVQYWYTSASLGARRDGETLTFQRHRVDALQNRRANLAPGAKTRNDYFTRVFVIDDVSTRRDEETLHQAWLAMQCQSDAGITVRFIRRSKYRELTRLLSTEIGSFDFCLVDRNVEDDPAILAIKAPPSLMVVNYAETPSAVVKTGFDITHGNHMRVRAAQDAFKVIMPDGASHAFVPGGDLYTNFERFASRVS